MYQSFQKQLCLSFCSHQNSFSSFKIEQEEQAKEPDEGNEKGESMIIMANVETHFLPILGQILILAIGLDQSFTRNCGVVMVLASSRGNSGKHDRDTVGD